MIHHVHIQTTLNNTVITLTDDTGKTKVSASAGALGFKNSRKAIKRIQANTKYLKKLFINRIIMIMIAIPTIII